MAYPLTLPNSPTNIIFTGVAGTGKTYLLLQLQRLYDETINLDNKEITKNLLGEYSWREIICAVLLTEDRTMSVAEIARHPLVQDKMQANNRSDNVTQTLWNCLGKHSHPDSSTVTFANRSANFYFDKNTDNRWYLLDEIKAELDEFLSDILQLYGYIKAPNLPKNKTSGVPFDQNLETTPPLEGQSYINTPSISRSRLVSFHQSYGYDEFVEGIRPSVDPKSGQMRYDIQAGAFLQLCRQAQSDPEHRYAMLIDEINRANTAQVFGELMSLIEPDKRAGQASQMQVTLAYSAKRISIPSNVDIYATMNTQDHSLTALDDAFRRRFEFIEMLPNASGLPTIYDDSGKAVDLAQLMTVINKRIAALIGKDAQLGQSYFYNICNLAQLAKRFARQILPQLQYNVERSVPMQGRGQAQGQLLWQILYGTAPDTLYQDNGYLLEYADNQGNPALNNTFNNDHYLDTVTAENLLALVAIIEQYNIKNFTIKDLDKESKTQGSKQLPDELIENNLSQDRLIYLTATPYQRIYQ